MAFKKREHKDKGRREQGRPNNKLIALLIFGSIAIMFIGVWGYNYSQLSPSIEKYIEDNGGAETFSGMEMDDNSTLSITAKKNAITIDCDVTSDDAENAKAEYEGESAEKNMKYMAAYYLISMKTNCRGLSSSVKYNVNLNGKTIKSIEMSHHEAKKFLDDLSDSVSEE